MSDVPILPTRLDWPSAIGNFLLNFAALDYLTVVFLKDHLERSEFAKLKERNFKKRVTRIAQYFSDNGYPKEKQEEFALLLGRFDPVRELRNRVAHGHLLARWDIEAETWVVSLSLPKNLDLEYSPDTKHLEFGELSANLTELMALIEGFKGLAGFSPAGRTGTDNPE